MRLNSHRHKTAHGPTGHAIYILTTYAKVTPWCLHYHITPLGFTSSERNYAGHKHKISANLGSTSSFTSYPKIVIELQKRLNELKMIRNVHIQDSDLANIFNEIELPIRNVLDI